TAVPELIKILHRESTPSLPLLRRALRETLLPEERLRLALALLPSDPDEAGFVIESMLEARADTVRGVRDQLRDHHPDLAPRLWSVLEKWDEPSARRFRAGCVLASFTPDDPRWVEQSPFLVEQLETQIAQNPSDLATFTNLLRPIRRVLLPDLLRSYRARDSK